MRAFPTCSCQRCQSARSWRRAAWFVLCLVVAFGSRAVAQVEMTWELSHLETRIPLDLSHDGRVWVVGHSQVGQNGEIVEYVLEGESVEDWSELVTVERSPFLAQRSKRRQRKGFVERLHTLQQSLASDCPSFEWSEQQSSATDYIVAWRHAGCGGYPAQRVLNRVFLAEGSIFGIKYSNQRDSPLASDARDRWLGMLGGVKLRDDPLPNARRVRIELAGGEVGELAFEGGVPVPTETETVKIEVVGLVTEKLLFSQGVGLAEIFEVRFKTGLKPITVRVDDVTDAEPRLLVDDQSPRFEDGKWQGRNAPVPVTPVDTPWIYEPGPWLRVLRFRMGYEQGPGQILYQARLIPESFKQVARKSLAGSQ